MSATLSILITIGAKEFDADLFRDCLASVQEQEQSGWQLVVAASFACSQEVERELRNSDLTGVADLLIRGEWADEATVRNEALAQASGDFVMFLGCSDTLAPNAVTELTPACEPSSTVAVYFGHDEVIEGEALPRSIFKPEFSPERLRSHDYIGPALAVRRLALIEIGCYRTGLDGAHDLDVMLRLSEQSVHIEHVPGVLYHRGPKSLPSTTAANRRAVLDHLERVEVNATVVDTEPVGCFRVIRHLEEHPLVSVVIPTRGSRGRVWGTTRSFVVEAVASMLENSTYQPVEFVVVADANTPPETLASLDRLGGDAVRIVPFDMEFNFSRKVNVGVEQSAGDYVLLLNDDTQLIAPTSVETMVGHLQDPGVAMVGAKLLFADGTLQHGGHLYNHHIGHACFGWRGDSPGPEPMVPLAVERECSGVTAAAALVRRSAFEDVGGFATELPLNYNDADFSLKIRKAGYRIIWTPWATWYHFESQTRDSRIEPSELDFMDRHWQTEIEHDPYYNPNLLPGRIDWLECPQTEKSA